MDLLDFEGEAMDAGDRLGMSELVSLARAKVAEERIGAAGG